MIIDTLEDLYIEQLNDVYSANNQALAIVKELVLAASDHKLTGALATGGGGLEFGVSSIEEIAKGHDETLDATCCEAMERLVRITHADALNREFGENAARDAMIIIQYQRLAHYVIAGIGCLAAFADRLELDRDLEALNNCLAAFSRGDRAMTDLARGRVERVSR